MVTYDLNLDDRTIAEARRDGFDPTADIVPSALGVPESTGLSPKDYEDEVKRALQLVQDVSASLVLEGSCLATPCPPALDGLKR